MPKFSLFSPYMSSETYIHDNMTWFQSVDKPLAHFRVTHQGASSHTAGIIGDDAVDDTVTDFDRGIEEHSDPSEAQPIPRRRQSPRRK